MTIEDEEMLNACAGPEATDLFREQQDWPQPGIYETDGHGNVALGSQALMFVTTGSNNHVIGGRDSIVHPIATPAGPLDWGRALLEVLAYLALVVIPLAAVLVIAAYIRS